jgi:hypothetical protein
MKRLPIILAWLLAVGTLSALETARTWTDTEGRTLTGVFVEATTQEVTVQRDDGSLTHIPRALLVAADLAYADKVQAARPITVLIEASRTQINQSKTTETKEIITVAQDLGFGITLTNQSKQAGQNLRVDYQLYYRRGAAGKSIMAQPLEHQGGSDPIAKLESLEKLNFRTTAVTIRNQTPRTVDRANGTLEYRWPTGTQETVYDKLDGIWVRVYQNGALIGEYLSSEDYRKDGWPAPAPAAPGGKKKAPGPAAPAT